MAPRHLPVGSIKKIGRTLDEAPSPAADEWTMLADRNPVSRLVSVYANLAHERGLLSVNAEHNISTVVEGILRGLPADAFERLSNLVGVSRKVLTDVVSISERTLSRRQVLKADESERVFRLGAAFQRAVEVLGTRQDAQRWFTSAQKALGGVTPLHFCRTDLGTREVEDLLGRIEHGVLA